MTWRSIFDFGRHEPVAIIEDLDWKDLDPAISPPATGTLISYVPQQDNYIHQVLKRDTYLLDDLFECPYCHGRTRNDDYGHCLACGGPRQ